MTTQEILSNPFTWGLALGLLFTFFAAYNYIRLKGELGRFRRHLSDKLEIEAETIARDDAEALAHVRMRSARGSEAVAFALRFDDEWKIAHTPAVGNPIH